ncbi:hypothetical protein EWM64_g6236, partial [Hericium alpestre]
MSISPPVRRLSSASSSSTKSSKREEDLINAYEAEEERIINVLSRKLERLQEEKIELENVLEAESESHVNRLSRELSALRMAQQQQQASPEAQGNGISNGTNGDRSSPVSRASTADPLTPSSDIMLDAMRRENEQLRNRLVDTERDYIRISRLNEIYREELIDYRRRVRLGDSSSVGVLTSPQLGLPVDNLIGLSSSLEPYSQPTHRRSMSSSSPTSSSASIALPLPTHGALRPGPSPSVPIPRPPSQIHRPVNNTSESTTPISHSPSSSESPYFSPIASANPTSMLSKARRAFLRLDGNGLDAASLGTRAALVSIRPSTLAVVVVRLAERASRAVGVAHRAY